ncbi:DUF5000 domain-containing lipoprotein [Polaribacter sp. 20A6]|uniref:DUF5000 domain-containing lipoprotein n=1 Tax=Polaribacter sp. 20A6 TaxID=2687289 RepID=UPI0013FD2764|nr:DUF5000 domain-containing lipoprotein [Polaribacter sp. 20A6]
MKTLKLFIMLLCIAAVYSCKEDKITSLVSDDGVAPGAVVVDASSVENLAGASNITYNLPDDEDVLYVVAEYQRTGSGELVSVKSSVYNNTLKVEGFAEAAQYNVELYAVDQSERKSEVAPVVINPEKPPYKYVCETLYAEEDYGGIKLFWENPETGLVTIEVYSVDASGSLIFQDAVYTSAPVGERLVLGQEAGETDYVFVVRDRYNNTCDQIEMTLTPRYLELFDRANFQAVYQPHDTETAYGWLLPHLFDGVMSGNNGFHTGSGWTSPDGELPEYENWSYNGIDLEVTMFTIDLGALSQVYRFKYWPRLGNFMWRHGNPHLFDLWGGETLNEDGSLDGWTLLLEDASPVKPSGRPGNDNTTEDIEAAEAGFNFEISPEAPKVRYIRFVQKVNQDRKSTLLHLSEIEFYGDNRQ